MNVSTSIPVKEADTDLTSTEREIAALWSEVLQNAAPPRSTDNFFAAGGDSMGMITLEFRIKEELGVELPPGTLLSAPTLHELSYIVDTLLRSL
jgi:acyl carrier protein